MNVKGKGVAGKASQKLLKTKGEFSGVGRSVAVRQPLERKNFTTGSTEDTEKRTKDVTT
jgi:hypothetical protein